MPGLALLAAIAKPTAIFALVVALATSMFLLKRAYERTGSLKASLETCTTRMVEMNNVRKERDSVDGRNRALGDDALYDGLLK